MKGLRIYFLVVASCCIWLLGSAKAHSSECNQLRYQATDALSSKSERVKVDQLASNISELDPSVFECEVGALVNSALDESLSPYFKRLDGGNVLEGCGYKDASKVFDSLTYERRLASLKILGKLEQGWRLRNQTEEAALSIYSLLSCLELASERMAVDKEGRRWRELWAAIEAAHANAEGLYRSQVRLIRQQILDCSALLQKIKNTESFKKYVRSRFGAAAVLVAVHFTVEAAAKEDCVDGDWLRKSIENIEAGLEAAVFAGSIEGWRFVNDGVYVLSLLSILSGDDSKFEQYSRYFTEPLSLVSDQNVFKENVHDVSKILLRTADSERATKSLPPYLDQVYIKDPVPGFSQKKPLRSHYSMSDVGLVLEKISAQSNWSCPPSKCLPNILRLDALVRQNLFKNDIRIVAGSYLEEGQALNGKKFICRQLKTENTKKCQFVVTKFDVYYRISTLEINELEAERLARSLKERGIRHFLSRPRLLPSL